MPQQGTQVWALHRRIRDAGHRPHPARRPAAISSSSTRNIPASASRPSRAPCAISRRRDLPAIVRVPSKSTTISPAPWTWAPKASWCRWSTRPRRPARSSRTMKYHPDRQARRRAASRMTTIRAPAPSPKFAAANKRITLFCQIETADGVENADAIAAIDGRRLPLGRPFRSFGLARHSRPIRPSRFHRGHRRTSPRRAKHNKALGPPRADAATGIDYRRGLRFHLLFRRRLGAAGALRGGLDAMRGHRRRPARRPSQAGEGAEPWPKFRVAALRRFPESGRHADLSDFDLAPLAATPGVESPFSTRSTAHARRPARRFRRADPAGPSLRRAERSAERPACRRRALRRRL